MTISHRDLINRGDKKPGDAITFIVQGQPIAKNRLFGLPRYGQLSPFTRNQTIPYENLVRLVAAEAMQGLAPLVQPVALTIRALIAIPVSWPTAKQQDALAGLIKPIKQPPLDPIVKAVKAACHGVVWKSDAQVVDCIASKRYGKPCVDIAILGL